MNRNVIISSLRSFLKARELRAIFDNAAYHALQVTSSIKFEITGIAVNGKPIGLIRVTVWDESSETQCRPVLQKIRQISDITKYCPNSTWIRVSLNII